MCSRFLGTLETSLFSEKHSLTLLTTNPREPIEDLPQTNGPIGWSTNLSTLKGVEVVRVSLFLRLFTQLVVTITKLVSPDT